ncbi:MAG: tyrosine-type recombinase/integrase [Anaerolineae bacterium]
MILSEAIESLAVATLADGRSERTAGDYRQKLGALLTFLGDRDVATITVDELRRFVVGLRTRSSRYAGHPARDELAGGLSPASIAGYIRALKRLFAWLVEEGVTVSNPARRIKTPKIARGEPKAYHADDFPKLLEATAGDEPVQLRDRALLLFLADTGCRAGGAAGLRLGDLDFGGNTARVIEKGEKTRRVPFSEPTAAALQAWLAVRPQFEGNWLWVNMGRRGLAHLTADGIGEVLRRMKKRAGIEGPCNPHSFRHGFAREYLLAGGDLGTLADLLGHSDVQVTWQHYAIFRTAELAIKHDKHSPIARMGREGKL